jgi:hypothetical protein
MVVHPSAGTWASRPESCTVVLSDCLRPVRLHRRSWTNRISLLAVLHGESSDGQRRMTSNSADSDQSLVASVLGPNEPIAWHGRANMRIVRDSDYRSIAFGLICIAVGVPIAAFSGLPLLPKAIAIVIIVCGVVLSVGNTAAAHWRRRHSIFAITNQRALVIESSRRIRVKSVPLESSVLLGVWRWDCE